MFEKLENRQLFSTVFDNHILTVTGSAASDNIVVQKIAGGLIQVTENGVVQGAFDVDTSESSRPIKIYANGGNDVVTVNANVDWNVEIYGGNGHDSITGGSGQDYIDPGMGNDTVHGGADDDQFVNGSYIVGLALPADSDQFYGDAGTEDSISYYGRSQGVVVTLDDLADDGIATAVAGADSAEKDNVHSDVEGVVGTNSADYLYGNIYSNNLTGYAGKDSLYGNGAGDTITGGADADSIYGGSGSDWIMGDAGNDYLDASSGNDTIRGGTGSDTMVGGTGTDTVEYENHAAAVIVRLDGVQNDGSVGENDWIKSDVENATGSDHNDQLYGSDGNNFLDGKNGNDSLYAGFGDDTLMNSQGGDLFVGGPGVDTVNYQYAWQALTIDLDNIADDGMAGEGDNVQTSVEVVIGGQFNDKITGSVFANTLIGNGGNDTLLGLGGNDVLWGGAGNDSLDGGADNDTLWGEAGTDTLIGGSGVNVLNP